MATDDVVELASDPFDEEGGGRQVPTGDWKR
jgi:hypothetical protein